MKDLEVPKSLTRRALNASSILGVMAFFAVIAAIGFGEENPAMSIVMTAVFTACAYLSLKEDGQIK